MMWRFSVLINTLTFGPRGWTICARLYDQNVNGCSRSRKICKAIDWVCGDRHHCRNSWIYHDVK